MPFGTPNKSGTRRAVIRANRPDTFHQWLAQHRADGSLASLWLALAFVAGAAAILSLRGDVVAFKPGQYAPHDITARVEFTFHDQDDYADAQAQARLLQPRVYRELVGLPAQVEQRLLELPRRVTGLNEAELPADLAGIIEGATLTRVREIAADPRQRSDYEQAVREYAETLRKLDLVLLPDEQRLAEVDRAIIVPRRGSIRGDETYAPRMQDELMGRLARAVETHFAGVLAPAVLRLTARWAAPTHELDAAATAQAQNLAAANVPPTAGDRRYALHQVIVPRGEIRDKDFQILRAEARAYRKQQDAAGWLSWGGTLLIVTLLTAMLCTYVVQFQPRIVRNHARALSVVGLMLASLLVAQLSGIGSSPIYVFGLAPTLLVAMIMAIVYDRRFAVGVGTVHALLVTLGLNEGVGFTLILLAGLVTACVMLDEVRTRSKLVEVGGLAAVAMIVATIAAGMLRLDPMAYSFRNSLHAGAAGLGVGFIVLGILPFIERAFRITTAMTLLELADSSQPLLRRIASEAPGTWNHSQQVAAMAEEAAEAIGANSLLCRVGAYYHDAGKINKPEYFVENQQDGVNRHQTISPSVSVLIIIGHVKDGIELAREYNLPTSLFPFIQQHHGTTLVEFFYDRALRQNDPEMHEVSETQYRYPGPKPKSREIAIVMLADCCESAARAMSEPTPTRIESLVNDLAMKRLLDGQLDECDMTMRELELVKRSLIKSLLGFYHGRVAYPSTSVTQAAGSTAVVTASTDQSPPAARSA